MIGNKVRASTLLLLWLLILQCSFDSCFGHILCLENERHALLRFKQQLIVPQNRLVSWTASQPECCEWAEIVCDNLTGHVKQLHLDNPLEGYALQGRINPSLLELKHLDYLDLSYNDFRGIPIPNFFGSLVSLTYLDLSDAGFQGLIPRQLENLTNLNYLSITSSSLYVDNLHWLYGMSSLVHLDLLSVDLSLSSHEWLGIVNSIPSLQELHLSDCQLAFMPSLSSVNFTSLSVLDISDNSFYDCSIPEWILSLSNLKSLDLSSNWFAGSIPDGSSNLSSLTVLKLTGNDLYSPLPQWLFELPSLVTLSLAVDFVSTLPTDFPNLTSLTHLELHNSYFSSSIPDWMYRFPRLESLDLSSSSLKGEISGAIQNLTSLVTLDLSDNELEGTIPKTTRSLCNLQRISLSDNNLGGEISQAIENIAGCGSRDLLSINLAMNNFSGALSDEIGILGNLRDLNLAFNVISGSIPESLLRLSSLTSLDLSHNRLVGSVPPSLGILSNLEQLRIGHNELKGFLSEVHFRNITNLRRLEASNNNLTLKVDSNWKPPFHLYWLDLSCWNIGPKFPSWLQYQDDLSELNLFRTEISDSIPSWFWNFTYNMDYLNLSHNQINGELPTSLRFETNLPWMTMFLSLNQFNGPLPQTSTNISVLDLSKNSFSGSISELLCNPMAKVNNLEILHLGSNHLSGEIPNCWMHWKSSTTINLENNNLSGKLPSSIANLPLLESLHLRNNSLSGEIPVSLQECTKLVVLDLGLNSLTGKLPKWLSSFQNLIALLLPSNKLEGGIPSELCQLGSLQILNLAGNNLSGSIPTCIHNLTAMTIKQSSRKRIVYFSFYDGVFIENALVITKGNEVQYDGFLMLATNLDISNNYLAGDIPQEITALLGLQSLNLSRNDLTGEIPTNIGDMQELESIDLSRNKISGRIPQSMSTMHFLCYLNVSSNNLSGEIPLSTQLQSFNPSSFTGNKLCGAPLTENCAVPLGTESGNDDKGEEGAEDNEFYLGMVTGFVVGFWGVFGPLLYSRSWRIFYFRFLSREWCKLCSIFSK